MIVAFTIVAVWVVCGIVAYGITLADFDRQWPAQAWDRGPGNRPIALAMGIGGPFGLGVAAFCSRCRHGIKFTPLTYDEVVAEHVKKYPMLPVDEWIRR